MTETRLTQGARISIGGVRIDGRGLEAMDVLEVASVVGRFMFERAEVRDGDRARICTWSLPSIVGLLWPGQAMTAGTAQRVRRILRVNGFVAIGGGLQPWVGYRVPAELPLEWVGGMPAVAKVKVEMPAEEPVRTRYACTACAAVFDTKSERDAHMARHHRPKKEEGTVATATKEEAAVTDRHGYRFSKVKCDICGKPQGANRLRPHMRTHQPNEPQAALLEAIREMPGEHPRDYAEVLDRTPAATSYDLRMLRAMELIRSEGAKGGIRYWPVETEVEEAPVSTPDEAIEALGGPQAAADEQPAPVYRCFVCEGVWPSLDGLNRHLEQAHPAPRRAVPPAAPRTLEVGDTTRIRQAIVIGENLLVLEGVVFTIEKRPVSQ